MSDVIAQTDEHGNESKDVSHLEDTVKGVTGPWHGSDHNDDEGGDRNPAIYDIELSILGSEIAFSSPFDNYKQVSPGHLHFERNLTVSNNVPDSSSKHQSARYLVPDLEPLVTLANQETKDIVPHTEGDTEWEVGGCDISAPFVISSGATVGGFRLEV